MTEPTPIHYLKIEVTLEGHSFAADGDFQLDEHFSKVFSQFINAISERPGQIDQIAGALEMQSTELQTAVDASKLP